MTPSKDELAKLLVFADEHGNIRAATRLPIEVSGSGAPTVIGIHVSGATRHEVALPDLEAAEDLRFEEWCLDLAGESPTLVRRAPRT
jgi:hypothetical protein